MEPMEPDSKCLMGLKETEGGKTQNNQLLTEQFYTAMEEKNKTRTTDYMFGLHILKFQC